MILSVALTLTLAGHGGQDRLTEATRLYADLKYEKALVLLGKALVEPGVTPAERAQVYLYTGLCLFMLGDEARALGAFKEALTSDPEITLPPHPGPKAERLFATALLESPRPPAPEEHLKEVAPPVPVPGEAIRLEPTARPRRIWPVVVAGAAAAVAVGIGAFLGASAARDNQAAQAAMYGADRQRLAETAGGKAAAANVLFGAAVVCGGAGVVLLVTF